MRMNELKIIGSAEPAIVVPLPASVPQLLPTIQRAPFTEQLKLSSVIGPSNADYA